jgi:hypothetical protein
LFVPESAHFSLEEGAARSSKTSVSTPENYRCPDPTCHQFTVYTAGKITEQYTVVYILLEHSATASTHKYISEIKKDMASDRSGTDTETKIVQNLRHSPLNMQFIYRTTIYLSVRYEVSDLLHVRSTFLCLMPEDSLHQKTRCGE